MYIIEYGPDNCCLTKNNNNHNNKRPGMEKLTQMFRKAGEAVTRLTWQNEKILIEKKLK